MSHVIIPASASWPVTLRAGGLVLRPMRRRDRSVWEQVRQANRTWLSTWDATAPPESWPAHYTFANMLTNQRRMARDGRSLPWVLAWDDGWPDRPVRVPRLIGQVTVSSITYGSARYAYIGYWIDHGWAGHGLVPLGVALAADYCFQTLRLHRLEIDILPENARSHRVVQKLGFTPDGQRRSLLHINGAWREHDAFVMTADQAPASLVARFLAGRPVPSGAMMSVT